MTSCASTENRGRGGGGADGVLRCGTPPKRGKNVLPAHHKRRKPTATAVPWGDGPRSHGIIARQPALVTYIAKPGARKQHGTPRHPRLPTRH